MWEKGARPSAFRCCWTSVRAGTLALGLPERLVLFGFSVLPGPEFLELARAVATQVDVHLFLLEPGEFDGARLYDLLPASGPFPAAGSGPTIRPRRPSNRHCSGRGDDWLGRRHCCWPTPGSPGYRPRSVPSGADTEDRRRHGGGDALSPTLLERLQHQIRTAGRAGRVPVPTDPSDRSVQFHACYGPIRQVQVARDALLHLLNQPGSELAEEDILVLCPALDRFAPLIEAVFGPSTEASRPRTVTRPFPRHRLPPRRRMVDPVLLHSATGSPISPSGPPIRSSVRPPPCLALVSGRFESTEVLDFLNLGPVRESLGFDDDDLSTIAEWVGDTHVRWGLDPVQRTRFGVPGVLTGNTWRAALDRLLLGSAVEDTGLGLAIGDVAPFGVEGSDVDTLGRLAEALGHLATLDAEVATARPIDEWVPVLRRACGALLAAPRGGEWQVEALHRIFADVLDASTQGAPSTVPLTFADVRRLVRRAV